MWIPRGLYTTVISFLFSSGGILYTSRVKIARNIGFWRRKNIFHYSYISNIQNNLSFLFLWVFRQTKGRTTALYTAVISVNSRQYSRAHQVLAAELPNHWDKTLPVSAWAYNQNRTRTWSQNSESFRPHKIISCTGLQPWWLGQILTGSVVTTLSSGDYSRMDGGPLTTTTGL